MKSLARDQIETLVREVEDDAYGLALAITPSREAADLLMRDAFGDEARAFAGSRTTTDLIERLRVRIRSRAGQREGARRWFAMPRSSRPAQARPESAPRPVAVGPELHARLVDRVEEHQFIESTGPRKAVLIALLGVVAVVAVVAVEWVRLDALHAAQPTIAHALPAAGAIDIPIHGDFSVSFGRRLGSQPRLQVQPADGMLGAISWDGSTLVVSYQGLHNATHYQLILDADYVSRFKDHGHYQQRWSFTTEPYPILMSVDPSDGATVVPRNGVVQLAFDHQPLAQPRISFQPADGDTQPGTWTGTTWAVPYTGLKPLTTYRATAVVDFGVASAMITRSWLFTTEPGMPPAGVPVLWHSQNDPGNRGNAVRMLALDWNGRLVGTMYAPVTTQSSDGSIVGTSDGTYLDRSGARLSELSGIPFYPVIADDNRSVCELSSSVAGGVSDQLWLRFGLASGPLRAVAPMGSFGARSGFGIIACSARNDRAVIVYSGMGGPTAVKVIALSSGHVIYQHAYTLAVANVVSAPDGRYLAEQMPVAGSYGMPGATVIRRVSDGAIVARLDNQVVVRFSWDDERVVVTNPNQSGAAGTVALVAWPSRRVLWSVSTSGQEPVVAWAEPNGSKMAIASATQSGWPLDRLWIVDADGRAALVLSELFYAASVTGS